MTHKTSNITLYKIADLFSNGKLTGEQFTTTSLCYDEPDHIVTLTKKSVDVQRRTGISYANLKNGFEFDEPFIGRLPKLLCFWEKRKMRYAEWTARGNHIRGCIGYLYTPAFEEKSRFISKKEKTSMHKTVVNPERIEDYTKTKEKQLNGELVEEQFLICKNNFVELRRKTIGLKKNKKGMIIHREDFDELFAFFELWRKRRNQYITIDDVNCKTNDTDVMKWI